MTVGSIDPSTLRVSEIELRARLGDRAGQVACVYERCVSAVQSAAEGRYVALTVQVTDNNGESLRLDGHPVESRALAKNLQGVSRAYLMAATLGVGVDRLLRKYTQISGAELALADGYASALCEALCDEVSDRLSEGIVTRPRFSPGYGDFPLSEQRWLLDKLSAGRTLGITLGDSLLMTPVKSVSAVMGIEDEG